MANCVDCFENCADKRTTDRCVVYTGPDIPALGICSGDPISVVEQAVLETVVTVTDGTGIDLSDLDLNCQAIIDAIGTDDVNLVNILQVLIDQACSLRELIEENTPGPMVFDIACLVGLPENPCATDILQAAVNLLCELKEDVEAIEADYVKASELCAMVTECLSEVSTQEYTKMPKYVALPYMGPMGVFDSTGAGLEAFGYDKVYICNGNNGTQDMRGRAAVGANTNVVGPVMDAAVDPAVLANAGYGIAVNTKKGAYTHTLATTEIPAHTHSVTDPGHTHTYERLTSAAHPGGTSQTDQRNPSTANTGSATTGITIASTGGGQPHNNTQPSIGVVWIMYIP